MPTESSGWEIFEELEAIIPKAINLAMKEFGIILLTEIKKEAPVGETGFLRAGHDMNIQDNIGEILCNVFYWRHVVYGHRVLTTDKSRKWWFWYLKNILGGSYQRKTDGPVGYVPPNDYILRASVNVMSKIDMEAIFMKYLRSLL